ncbi:MAG TPA: TIM-barrel domain-containing protein [Gemmataceae bacterium]|nr:TIM-barrel domain-containing protein [Gemmataceae bacterium]
MSRPTVPIVASGFALAACLLAPSTATARPLRHGDAPAELAVGVVSERTVRIALSPLDEDGKPRPGPASTVLVESKPETKLRVCELAGAKEVEAGKLRVRVSPDPLTITVRGPGDAIVQELVVSEADASVTFRTAAPVLGLGEGGLQFDRRGNYYRLVNGQVSPPMAAPLATHGGTILVPFLIGTEGWALFFHRPSGEFDLRGEKGRFIPRNDTAGKEPLELFVVALSEPADALAEYYRLTGKPVMPPKWVLGYMQSHRTLAGPEEPVAIARTFREKKLPCDAVIYLGTGYCPAGWNIGHGTFEFNPKTFPRPGQTIDALHGLNFRLVLHVNQAPRTMFGASVAEPSDAPNHIRNYWARHSQLLALGVDGWWPDDGDELPVEARLARHRCYYEGPLSERPNARPWSLHRNGYAGVQRYGGWIWSGDVQSRWATLEAHVPVGVNDSLSLTPFWGTDTGGFVPTRDFTGELYVRWFQFSVFNPLFRSHGRTWKLRLPWGWNTGDPGPVETNLKPDPAELHNAEVEPICRKYLELRYRLLPYNYALMREACDTGLPPMRALWLHHPNDPAAVKLGDEFQWGGDLLVAPVTAKGATERKLYLPEGDWYDFWTNEKQTGKREVTRKVDLATLPLYVRAGAIIPLDPVRQYTAQPTDEPTTIRVYPGRDGEFRLYEDDGESLDYLKGKFTRTRLKWDDTARRLAIEPDGQIGFVTGPRTFVVELVTGGKPQAVRYMGKRVEVMF